DADDPQRPSLVRAMWLSRVSVVRSMSLMGQHQPQPAPVTTYHSPLTTLLAWSVHLYTALGLVAAAAIAVLIVHGDAVAFRAAFLLMVIATLIDATDGTLARAARVK